MFEPTNTERASCAHASVATYAVLTGMNCTEQDQEVCVGDLLASLMHLCVAKGYDFEDKLRIARMHFEAETSEG